MTSKRLLLLSATCLLVSGMARAADDSATINGITFYGIVDLNLTYQTHGTPPDTQGGVGLLYLTNAADNKGRLSLSQSAMSQSRIGLKGAEDLGNGFTGLFRLETGVNPVGGRITDGIGSVADQNYKPLTRRTGGADSSHDGGAFERAAYVGAQHATYGTITLGRQTNVNADTIASYNPQYGSYAFSPIGYSGNYGGGGGATEDARWDQSVKYLGAWGLVRLGLNYRFAGERTGNDDAKGADIGLDYAGFSLDGVYLTQKDSVFAGPLTAPLTAAQYGALYALTSAQIAALPAAARYGAPSNSIAGTVFDDQTYTIAAKYVWDKFKFFAGYENITSKNPSHPLPAGTLDVGSYVLATVNNAAFPNHRIFEVEWVGARYAATPNLEFSAGYYRIGQNHYYASAAIAAECAASKTKSGQCEGEINALSVTADYKLSKRFDVYAGAQWSQALGGLGSGINTGAYLHNNTIDPTIGMRYSF